MSFKIDVTKKHLTVSLVLHLFFDDFSTEKVFNSIKDEFGDSNICDNCFYIYHYIEEKILRTNAAVAIKDAKNPKDLKNDLENNLIIPGNLLGSTRFEVRVGYVVEK